MVLPAFPQVDVDDPVAYWSFDDMSTLLSNRVTSGKFHNAATLIGQPGVGLADGAAGIVGNAMLLDGHSAIDLPYHQDNLGRSFTISFWYWQQTNDTRQCIFQSRDNYICSHENGYDPPYEEFACYVGQKYIGKVSSDLQKWIHLTHVFSLEENTVRLSVYTNGVQALTGSANAIEMFEVYRLRGLHIGAYRFANEDEPGGNRAFKGMIDELALWDRALSESEVQAIYQRGTGGGKLEFTTEDIPIIELDGIERCFELNVSNGISASVLYNGWLADRIQDPMYPSIVEDTAVFTNPIPDTAGHVDGPFDAEATDFGWHIPLTGAFQTLPQSDFTIEAWVRRIESGDYSNDIIAGNFFSENLGVINFQLQGNTLRLYLKDAAGTVNDITGNSTELLESGILDGKWHHVIGMVNGSTNYLYLDGEELKRQESTIGAYSLGGDYYYLGDDAREQTWGEYDGEMGDVRFWKRALSTNEIANLADAGKPGFQGLSKTDLLAEYALYEAFDAVNAFPKLKVSLDEPLLRQFTMTNFSVEAVFRTKDLDRSTLLGNYVDNKHNVLNLELIGTNDIRIVLINNGEADCFMRRSPNNINTRDGQWHRLVAVRRDGMAYLYLDGEQQGEAQNDSTGAFKLDTDYIYFERDARNYAPYTLEEGSVSDIRFWNRALSN
ncbi:MAG: LamG domain-containing protein, partial [Kiritimatiellia bacterium]